MSEYYLDEEFPTFSDPETYEAFQQFAEKWRSSTFEELQFQLESLQNENNRLKTQIKALSNIKKNWDEKIKEIRGVRLKELLKDVQECAYLVDYEYEYAHVKCDKCDGERKIHFRSPSGKELTELCSCSSQVSRYFLIEIPIYKIEIYNHMEKKKFILCTFTGKENLKTSTLQASFKMRLTMKRFLRSVLTARSFLAKNELRIMSDSKMQRRKIDENA